MSYNIYYSSDGFDFVLYQDLSKVDSELILSYRNNFNVRRWMFNSNKISLTEHSKFIKKLNKNLNKFYFAIFRNKKIIACVNFESIEKDEYFVGHFLNPSLLSSGMGIYFEYVYLKFFFEHIKANKIKARVKKENQPIIKIHRLCNFKEINNKKSKYYDYEFSINQYNKIPKNMNEFISFLITKYKKNDF